MTTEGKLKRSRNPLDYDFTEPEALTRYVTETGKILPRKLTGLTAKQQRHIAKAIKRARNMVTMKRPGAHDAPKAASWAAFLLSGRWRVAPPGRRRIEA